MASYPCIEVPFGDFMNAQTPQAQAAFITSCRYGSFPPPEEMEKINEHMMIWMNTSQQAHPSRVKRYSFDGHQATKMWSVTAIS